MIDPHSDDFSFKKLFIPLTVIKAIHIIVITGFLVFGNMLFNNFVEDDLSYIIDNPYTHSVNLSYAFGPNLFNGLGQYRPLPELYFSFLYSLFSTTPFFYHLIQLIFHIFATILLYIVFNKFFSNTIALFLSLVFLVHPINVESVSYIAQTINPIFFILGISAFLISTKKNLNRKDLVATFLLILLSVLTKETGVLFLVLIFFYTFLYRNKHRAIIYISGIFTLLIYFFIRFFIGGVGFATRPLIPIADTSIMERLINLPEVIFYYLKTFFFPKTLSIDQQWIITKISFNNFYLPLLLDITFFFIILLACVHFLKKSRKIFKHILFFFLWFLLGLFLHSQIFPLDKTVADRWFYFTMAGLLGVFGVAINNIKISNQKVKIFVFVLSISIIIALSVRTIVRNFDWKDPILLYSHDIRYNKNFDIANGLGVAYGKKKEYSKAIYYLKKSVEMRPYESNLSNLAIIYARLGDLHKAKKYFQQALNSKDYNLYKEHKHSLKTYREYVKLLLFYEKNSSVISILKKATADYPDSSTLWFYLALAYYMQQDNINSLKAAYNAYELDPNQETNLVIKTIQNKEAIEGTFTGFNNEAIKFIIN